MRALRAQYFLTYGVIGSTLPYVSVFLKGQQLTETQIALVQAAASVPLVLSPVLVTLLADMRMDARRVMAAAFALSALTLVAMPTVAGFWGLMAIYGLHSLAYVPIMPLQDGINFSLQEERRAAGRPTLAYHRVRVWGTIGFIVPSVVIFALMKLGAPVGVALVAGAGFAVLGGLNTLLLPHPVIGERAAPAPPAESPIPTLAAARTMLRPPLVVFCLAIFLVNIAAAVYYTFYPIYLTNRVHLPERWVGPVMNIGVVIEILFMLSFGRLMARLGLKGLMVLGVGCIALRMALLAAVPTMAVAVGIQVFHGIMVLVMQVAPPVLLNRHADDRCRHSMQGLYTMSVVGAGRISGNLLAGPIAQWSMTGVFGYAAGLTAIAAALLAVAFRDASPKAEVTNAAPDPLASADTPG